MGFKDKAKDKLKLFKDKAYYGLDHFAQLFFGKDIQDILTSIKSGFKEGLTSKPFTATIASISQYLTKLIGVLFVTTFAFFPEVISGIFWTFLIVFIVMIVLTIILFIFFRHEIIAASFIFGGDPFTSIIKQIGVVLLLLTVTFFLPSPNYNNILGLRFSTLVVYVFFIIAFFISFLIASLKFPKILIFGSLHVALLYFLIPLGIFYMVTQTCTNSISLLNFNVPFISNYFDKYSCEKLTSTSVVKTGKEYVVPYSSGIGVKIGLNEMLPLPAGREYKEVVFLENHYKSDINLESIQPYIKSSYYNVIFKPTDYSQKKSMLKSGEEYGEEITFDPSNLEISSEKECKYSAETIKKAGYNPECADDLPCADAKSTCVMTGRLQCKCVNWISATCSGAPLNIILDIRHTGYLVGNGTLYYFEDYYGGSLPYYKYSQYPAEASFNFIPNPWFQRRYGGYIDEIQMFAQIKVSGSQPEITSLEVEPIETLINITFGNKYFIEEKIGINKKNCNLNEKLEEINKLIKESGKWSGILCTFSPPSVTTIIKDLTKNEEILNTDVSIALINQYCEAQSQYPNIKLDEDIEKRLTKDYVEYLRKIRNLKKEIRDVINKHGLCSYLQKINETAKEEEKSKMKETEMIKENLRKVNVFVRFDYKTTESFVSRKIYPYYTSACEYKK
jgi:hypothetical protein